MVYVVVQVAVNVLQKKLLKLLQRTLAVVELVAAFLIRPPFAIVSTIKPKFHLSFDALDKIHLA